MIFDAHTHIHFAAYDADRDAVIHRAQEAGVQMLAVGTQADTSLSAVRLAEQYPRDIWAAVGLHPVHTSASYHDEKELGGGEAAKAFAPLEISRPGAAAAVPNRQGGFLTGFVSRGEEFDYSYYESLAKKSRVVAIGECGLDYYRLTPETKEKQVSAFKEHMRLAESVGKALMIHCRPSKGTDDAYEDLLSLVTSRQSLTTIPKIVHFYVGSPAMTKKLLDAGFYFTFGGVITFARDYDESIRLIPLERMLLETDAPYVAPEPYRGKKNEPAYIVETAKKLAEIKGVDFLKISEATTSNAKKVFQIKK